VVVAVVVLVEYDVVYVVSGVKTVRFTTLMAYSAECNQVFRIEIIGQHQ